MKILINMTVLQFKMLLRNKMLLVGSLGVAVISMVIFGLVFGSNNAQPLRVGLLDLDKSPVSQQIVAALKKDAGLQITEGEQTELLDTMKKGAYGAVVVIQPGFMAGLATAQAKVQLYVNDSDMIMAARSRGTINGIFDSVSKQATGYKEVVQVAEQKISVRAMRAIDYLTPGMLGVTIMFGNLFVGVALISWRERNTLKRLSATPLKAWQLILAQIFAQIALTIAQVVIILGLGVTLFNIQFSTSWILPLLVFTLVGAFSMISLGYAIGNFAQKEQAATSLINLISLPMMFLSGSYFVVSPPDFLKPVVDALPLTHLNSAFRQVMLSDAAFGSLLPNLAVLAGFGVVLLAISIRTFRWSR